MNDTWIRVTDRLRLEPFAPNHLDGLSALDAEPEVMRFLGGTRQREDTRQSIANQQAKWAQHGFGWWSVFERKSNTLIGAACLQHLAHDEANPLEIGWRLLPAAQGHGYATEAGQAAMTYGFDVVGVNYLTAVAHPDNVASHRVMQRLGMLYKGVETYYDEPCVVYHITKPD